jgi:hypothetical protein
MVIIEVSNREVLICFISLNSPFFYSALKREEKRKKMKEKKRGERFLL